MLDMFTHNDAFSVVSLTDAINKPLFKPGRLGQMRLFGETSVSTLTIVIEQQNDMLILEPPTPRGGPGTTMDKQKRDLRSVVIPHFQIDDAVMAEEVQGVRAFGQENAVEMDMAKVAERMMTARSSLEVTKEYARGGAVIGIVTYADGRTLDIFDLFDIAQDEEIAFNLAATQDGALRKKCADVIRQMARNLAGIPFTGIHALCGDAFFDDLLKNKEIRETFLNHPAAAQLRAAYIQADQSWGGLEFGGTTWENHRGYVGATDFIHTDECHLFCPRRPIGGFSNC